MSNARNLARLIVDSGGDVEVSSLGNVPPSNDASALTTGTLPVGRLPSSGVSASSLTTGTLPIARINDAGIPSTKLDSGAKPLGVGQSWQAVSRSVSTTYTNTTGRTILAHAYRDAGGANYTYIYGYVDGMQVHINSAIAPTGYSKPCGVVIAVPNGSTYQFTWASDGGSGLSFAELR